MSFKILHQFDISINQEVEDISTSIDNGKEIITKSKVIKPVVTTIILKEPSRKERQKLALFQGISYNEAIGLGLLPRLVMSQKITKHGDSPISGDEDKNLAMMNSKLQELSNDFIRLNTQNDADQEMKDKRERVLLEYIALEKKVTDINTAYQSVFAHTAEQYSQNRVISWLTLFLTYIRANGKDEVMFTGADFDGKEDRLGELEDAQDKVYFEAVTKLSTYWTLYYFGRASNSEDFGKIEADWKKQLEAQAKMKEEAAEEEKRKSAASEVATTPVIAEPITPPSPEVAPIVVP